MTANHALIRRPLIGAVAGLLLLSACGTTADSTPAIDTSVDRAAETTADPPDPTVSDTTVASPTTSTTAGPSTTAAPVPADPSPVEPATTTATTASPSSTLPPATLPPATTEPNTVPPADLAPIDVVDVAAGTVFGYSTFDAVDVDAVAADVSARLGSPTTDSEWLASVGQSCAGATHFRVLWWGDFRMTFERYQADEVVREELSAWTVGDPTVSTLAPIGDVPTPSPSNIVTLQGIGLGSTRTDVEAVWANVNNGGDNRLVVIDRGGSLIVGLDDDGQVVGFGDGPFDCPVDEVR